MENNIMHVEYTMATVRRSEGVCVEDILFGIGLVDRTKLTDVEIWFSDSGCKNIEYYK
jgi:hypothetical protein